MSSKTQLAANPDRLKEDCDNPVDMDTQHGHGHAAWKQTRSMDMDMQHGNRHAARTWTVGHAAWTWTCSVETDMFPTRLLTSEDECKWF